MSRTRLMQAHTDTQSDGTIILVDPDDTNITYTLESLMAAVQRGMTAREAEAMSVLAAAQRHQAVEREKAEAEAERRRQHEELMEEHIRPFLQDLTPYLDGMEEPDAEVLVHLPTEKRKTVRIIFEAELEVSDEAIAKTNGRFGLTFGEDGWTVREADVVGSTGRAKMSASFEEGTYEVSAENSLTNKPVTFEIREDKDKRISKLYHVDPITGNEVHKAALTFIREHIRPEVIADGMTADKLMNEKRPLAWPMESLYRLIKKQK